MPPLPIRDKLLIEPVYSQSTVNEAIDLGNIDIEFTHEGNTYSESAQGRLDFLPSNRLSFVIPTKEENTSFGFELGISDWDGEIGFKGTGISTKVYVGGVGKKYGGLELLPNKSNLTISPPSTDVVSTVFHLFNFPHFRGPDDYILQSEGSPTQRGTPCGCIQLEAGNWKIVISALQNTHELTQQLDRLGGFVITHVGHITRTDGSSSSDEEIQDVLNCLQHYLSFATGRWAGVSLPIGYDNAKVAIFRQWGTMITAAGSWNTGCTWTHWQKGELLKEVFPGFYDLWTSNTWRGPLSEILYWYCGANDRGIGIGVDTGLILAQTALETLAWTHCVLERKMVTPDAFKPRGLSAANKFRLLMSSIGVTPDIPDSLTALNSKSGEKWLDGMHALTGIRNIIVHPETTTQLPDGSYYDAWRLALWYIELAILRLCRHNGQYSNRLSECGFRLLEEVPWAS